MYLVFYTVKIVYVCVFMACSSSYCLCDTLMDPWNINSVTVSWMVISFSYAKFEEFSKLWRAAGLIGGKPSSKD